MQIQLDTVLTHRVRYFGENCENGILISHVKAVFFIVLRVVPHNLRRICALYIQCADIFPAEYKIVKCSVARAVVGVFRQRVDLLRVAS